jgi:hypothetical protein
VSCGDVALTVKFSELPLGRRDLEVDINVPNLVPL